MCGWASTDIELQIFEINCPEYSEALDLSFCALRSLWFFVMVSIWMERKPLGECVHLHSIHENYGNDLISWAFQLYQKYGEKQCHNPNSTLLHATQTSVALQFDQLKMARWESSQQPSSFLETRFSDNISIGTESQKFEYELIKLCTLNIYCSIFLSMLPAQRKRTSAPKLLKKWVKHTHTHTHMTCTHTQTAANKTQMYIMIILEKGKNSFSLFLFAILIN